MGIVIPIILKLLKSSKRELKLFFHGTVNELELAPDYINTYVSRL